MRSSISSSLEPGLERGGPWGRDLYTFVTSAAGHMMRTLQKPRKNRPSKRQVNHRRFLHNMIQRKFADIEAANYRLASALCFNKGEKNLLPVLSSKSPDSSGDSCQSDSLPGADKSRRQTDDISKSRSDELADLHAVRENEKNQVDMRNLSKHHAPTSSTCTTASNYQSEKIQNNDFSSDKPPKVTECFQTTDFFLPNCYTKKSQPTGSLSVNTQLSQKDSSFICCENQNEDVSLSFSPELSPLSDGFCDFSIQAFMEESGCVQVQKSAGEASLTDITDLFSVNKKDSDLLMEVEACFENVCAAELDVCAEDGFSLSGLADDFTTVEEDLPPYSWHEGQALSANCIPNNQRGSQTMGRSRCPHSKNTDVMQNQHHTSFTSHYDVTPLEMYQPCQEESPSMVPGCENDTSFTFFEGVAQSFSAPPHAPLHRSIPTPPHEDDWMFTNILTDRRSVFF